MPAAQQELGFFQSSKDDPNVKYLLALLANSDWRTAAEIIEDVFRSTEIRWGDRYVRELAEAATPEVISGQRGYKLIDLATVEEIKHFCTWMESQGKKMIARAEAVRRRAHGRLG